MSHLPHSRALCVTVMTFKEAIGSQLLDWGGRQPGSIPLPCPSNHNLYKVIIFNSHTFKREQIPCSINPLTCPYFCKTETFMFPFCLRFKRDGQMKLNGQIVI